MGQKGYKEIADEYRQKIQDGRLAPGDPMPSMSQICELFGVSIKTANRAFQQLKSEGLISPRSGVGTIVAERRNVTVTGAARLDRLRRTGEPYSRGERCIKHPTVFRSIWDPITADDLNLELRDEVAVRFYTYFDDEDTVTVRAAAAFHPRMINHVPELLDDSPLPKWRQDVYTDRTGRTVYRSPERRRARLAEPGELAGFGLPKDIAAPILELRTVFHDEEGPLESWTDLYAPGLWQVAD